MALVHQGLLVAFPYIQAVHRGSQHVAKVLGSTPALAIDLMHEKGRWDNQWCSLSIAVDAGSATFSSSSISTGTRSSSWGPCRSNSMRCGSPLAASVVEGAVVVPSGGEGGATSCSSHESNKLSSLLDTIPKLWQHHAPYWIIVASSVAHLVLLVQYPVIDCRMPTLMEGLSGTVLCFDCCFQYSMMQVSLVSQPVPC